MALQVWDDIADTLITVPTMTVLDGLARGRDAAQLDIESAWIAPNALGMTLLPAQMTPAWPSATGKWQASDYLIPTPSNWEGVQHRAAGDWFLASKGVSDGQWIPTQAQIVQNGGLCLEFFCYVPVHTYVPDVAQLKFGQYFTLHVHSNGTADMADGRPNAAQPYLVQGASLTAPSPASVLIGGAQAPTGANLAGKFVSVIVVPWRRGWVLVISNQGGWFEAFVGDTQIPASSTSSNPNLTPGESVYHQTTAAAQAQVCFTPQARAFWALSVLRWSLTGLVASPLLPLPYSAAAAPDVQNLQAEQQDGTSATLSLLDSDGNTFDPTASSDPTQIAYSITLSAPDAGQGWATATPQVFGAQITFARQLGQRTYNTGQITRIQSASLSMNRAEGRRTFSFTLDNPGEQWTSLKDLYNRAMYAEFVVDNIDGQTQTIFVGLTDASDFTDGSASKITIPCSGKRKRLRNSLLNDSQAFDGWEHGQAVYQILSDAGIPDENIVVIHDGVLLDSASFGQDPLWKPANGVSRDEFIQHMAETFSGWVYDEIGGIFYYVPTSYFTDLALDENGGVPQIFLSTPTDALTGLPLPAAMGPNATILVALSARQSDAVEVRANDIWVLGMDPDTGELLGAHYEDDDSISNNQASNYVGERRTFIFASGSIISTDMASACLGVIAPRLTQPIAPVSVTLPDLQMQALPLDGPVQIEGYPLGLVSAVSAQWEHDRMRVTEYQMTPLPQTSGNS